MSSIHITSDKNMNIIYISFVIYLMVLLNTEFTSAEGKQLNENYIMFDKKRPEVKDQLRSSEEIQRREVNPSLAGIPVEEVNPLTELDLPPSKLSNGKVMEGKNSSTAGGNDTSPEITTQSESNNTDKYNPTTTALITSQSFPNKVQTTSESTPKNQTSNEETLSDNDTTTNKNPTSQTPVLSSPTSSASPSLTGYVDTTTFKGGMNLWDFEGEWGKYDLKSLKEEEKPVPELQTSVDNVIFMSKMAAPVLLRKEFPPLINATITLTFYIKMATQGTLEMQGFVSSSEGEKMIFDLTKQELFEHNYLWFTNKYILGSYHEPFTVVIRLRSFARSIWAADAMTVRGWKISDQGDLPDSEEPSTSSTQSSKMVTTTYEITTRNMTPTTNDFDSNNSTEKKGIYDELNGGDNSSSPESWKDLAHIATAIWDAFYVFLALFCACLIALIILIVKHRCRDDPMPPAMATYSPRMSTYQIGKPRDNPSYETDSV